MSFENLILKLRAVAAASQAVAATAASAATTVTASMSAMERDAARQRELIDRVLSSSTSGNGDGPAVVDLASLMRQLLATIAAMNDPATSAFQKVNELNAAQYLIGLLRRFGGDAIKDINFGAMLTSKPTRKPSKTSVSSSSGSATTSVSVASAQGKMGW